MTVPTPVRVVVDTALLAAVRRWPPGMRVEMAREWSAELYAIVHDPAAGPAQRSWRSLRYAVSLACARGIEEESLTERGSMGMKRFWKPVAVLAAAPVLCLLAMAVIAAAGFPVLGLIQGEYEGVGVVEGQLGIDLAATVLVAVAPAGAVWPLARWFGRIAPVVLGSAGGRAVATVALIGAATVALVGVLVGGLGFVGLGSLPVAVGGVLVWAVALAAVAVVAARWWAAGRTAAGNAAAVVGGLAAVDAGVTALLLSHGDMDGAPLTYLPLWFPSAIWMGQFPDSWLGYTADDMNAAFVIPDIAIGYGHILVVVTVFVFGYLRPRRQPVPVAEPEREPSPAGTAG